jgi:ubiquinone/menaquinone biosynthesis C-methylase UbiE
MSTNYTQGYSPATTATHASRTAQTDASFLLPYLRPNHIILDIGCGPATITIGLAALVPNGSVTGVELTESILSQAQATIASTSPPPKNITLLQADLLKGLPFEDGTFDVVFSSQLFPHLPTRQMKVQAIKEMRRVCKEGGVVSTRDAAELHFFPRVYGLDTKWAGNMKRAIKFSCSSSAEEEESFAGGEMPGIYREVGGFKEVQVGAGTTVYSGAEARKWFVETSLNRLEDEEYRASWLRAGIKEEDVQETRVAFKGWEADDDAWYAALQAEVLGWK